MKKEKENLITDFRVCSDILTALGDKTRQHILLCLLKYEGNCNGLRIGDFVKLTNISRPAVSRHLQILKKAGIIKLRREGTKNYYYVDADKSCMDSLITLAQHIKSFMNILPDRRGEE